MKSNDEIIAEITKAHNEGAFENVVKIWDAVKSVSDKVCIHKQSAHIITNAMNVLCTPPPKPPITAERLDEILLLTRD